MPTKNKRRKLEPLLYRIDEAADMLGVSVISLRAIVKRKEIGHVRIHRLYCFSRKDLDSFIDARRVLAT